MLLKVMEIISEEDHEFVQHAIIHVVQHFQEEFGCTVSVSDNFKSNRNVISLDVTLPPNKEIFVPSTKELRVFRVDTKKQIMTVMYFPQKL